MNYEESVSDPPESYTLGKSVELEIHNFVTDYCITSLKNLAQTPVLCFSGAPSVAICKAIKYTASLYGMEGLYVGPRERKIMCVLYKTDLKPEKLINFEREFSTSDEDSEPYNSSDLGYTIFDDECSQQRTTNFGPRLQRSLVMEQVAKDVFMPSIKTVTNPTYLPYTIRLIPHPRPFTTFSSQRHIPSNLNNVECIEAATNLQTCTRSIMDGAQCKSLTQQQTWLEAVTIAVTREKGLNNYIYPDIYYPHNTYKATSTAASEIDQSRLEDYGITSISYETQQGYAINLPDWPKIKCGTVPYLNRNYVQWIHENVNNPLIVCTGYRFEEKMKKLDIHANKILEVYEFPQYFQTKHLLTVFNNIQCSVKWSNETHALLIMPNEELLIKASKKTQKTKILTRPLDIASPISTLVACRTDIDKILMELNEKYK